MPRCLNAKLVAVLPLLVLEINPKFNKKGSITSSTVPESSFIEADKVSIPTGPPPNFRISDCK